MFGELSCFRKTLAIEITIGRLVIEVEQAMCEPSFGGQRMRGVTGKRGGRLAKAGELVARLVEATEKLL
jgi:hypothetical protein